MSLEYLEKYIIKFINLKIGEHHYDFDVDPVFFDEFENSLVRNVKAKVEIILNKQKENFFQLDFWIQGEMLVNCDRCLDEILYPLDIKEKFLVKMGDRNTDPDNENIIYLPEDAFEINVSRPIYELINLSFPVKPVCKDIGKECNAEMIKIINEHQGRRTDRDQKPDPRWNKLKNLYNKINKENGAS